MPAKPTEKGYRKDGIEEIVSLDNLTRRGQP